MTQDPTYKLSEGCKFEIHARYGKCATRVPVEQAPAGPALDAAVAIALGKQVKWTDDVVIREPWPIYLAGMTSSSYYNSWKEEEDWREVPKYSTDIAAAWELVSNFNPDKLIMVKVILTSYSNPGCEWFYYDNDEDSDPEKEIYIEADTAPLAITRAYLKAKGVEWVEVPD